MNRRKGQSNSAIHNGANNSFGQEIIGALADFTDALEKGEVTKRLTCRQVKLDLRPKPYSPDLVKKTRRVLGVSQALFATFLGVSAKTVRSTASAWPPGTRARSAARRSRESRRRSSCLSSHGAVSGVSDFSEFEQTSSAS